MLQPYSLFILRNESAETMRLTVEASGRTVWTGDLRAGGRQMALSIVDRDTSPQVTCSTPGKPAVTSSGPYMTHSLPYVATVRLASCAKPQFRIKMLL